MDGERRGIGLHQPPSIMILFQDDEHERRFLIHGTKLRYGNVIGQTENTTLHEGSYLGQSVLIKVITSRAGEENFFREVRLLAEVNNDYIMKFIGFSLEPAMTIVTQIMHGGSLQRHLWSIRPLALDRKDALVLGLNISRAMEYLHENEIIHRDLNPRNIFLSASKKSAKLGDFGLCREGMEGDFSADVGSFRWMAPEVYSREQDGIRTITKRYNHKVDVYNFAIVLWELFTNKTPFRGMDGNMIAHVVLNNERPSLFETDIPEDIRPLLENCWSNDPQRRYEFSEISRDLQVALEAEHRAILEEKIE